MSECSQIVEVHSYVGACSDELRSASYQDTQLCVVQPSSCAQDTVCY